MDDTYQHDARAGLELTRSLLRHFDEVHREKGAVECKLCGQLTYKPDKQGLCSKISEGHNNYRLGRTVPDVYRGDQG